MTRPLLGQLELPFLAPPAAGEQLRRIQLGSGIVAYKLMRSRRRTIGITIDQRGVRIGAPRHTGLLEIESFMRLHADWICRKLDEWRASATVGPYVAHDGATLPVLGETWTVRLAGGRQHAHWQQAEREIRLEVRGGADPRPLLRRSLQERALDHFRERVGVYAVRLGRPMPALTLSSAQSRWGSCSHRSGIRLNWRLIHLPPAQIDYVVAHELAHLVEMNHSARFWSQVERLFPDYLSARDGLKVLAATVPRI